MTLQEQVTKEVEDFLKASGMAPRSLGMGALKDPNFVRELRKGRSPSLRTIEKVRVFMNDFGSGC